MIAAAVILIILAGSLADGIAWAVARRRARNRPAPWPPRRVVASVNSLEETF